MRIPHQEKGFRPFSLQDPLPDDNWPYSRQPANGHDPQYGIRSPKFYRHIYIRRDQLIFDIDTQIQMVAESRKNPDGTVNDSLSQATTKFSAMFYRWIDKHLGEIKTTMSAFVLERFRDTALNSIKDFEEVDITLLCPEWYDDTTFQQLCDAVHQYIVDATLFDFFSLTLTSKDPVTADKYTLMGTDKDEVKRLVNASKPGRIRKIQKPF